MRKFEDDFGWVALIDERPDGTAHVQVVTCDGYPVWDRSFPDPDTALARFGQSFPRFQEVA